MDHQPTISVIIPVYNCALYLPDAIQSILDQTFHPLELIVVDDGSDDGGGEVAKGRGPFIQYAYQARAGQGAARNRGVAAARGELLAFLDADDVFVPDKLERQVAAMNEAPRIDVVFGHMREFLSPEVGDPRAVHLREPVNYAPALLPSAMLIRRTAFEQVGPFSAGRGVGNWIDWYARMVERNLKAAVLPEIVLHRRLHAQNTSVRQRETKARYVQILKDALDRRRLGSPSGQ